MYQSALVLLTIVELKPAIRNENPKKGMD